MNLESNDIKNAIINGKTVLGIELGSTRIKAVLINENNVPIASGSHDWENKYVNNIWTYSLEDIWDGLQRSYQNMAENVKQQYGVTIGTIGAIGISAMMHGYMAMIHGHSTMIPG